MLTPGIGRVSAATPGPSMTLNGSRSIFSAAGGFGTGVSSALVSSHRTSQLADTGSIEKDMSPAKSRESYKHMATAVLGKRSRDRLEHWSWQRVLVNQLLESTWYSAFMGLIIVANTILVIHETDLRASEPPTVPGWVSAASNCFLIMYSIEISLRLYTYRLSFFGGLWNWLDLTVVITDCCAELATAGGLDNLPSVSVLRVFRLMRLVRLVAILSVFQELQTMLLGFASAMKAMLWASLMIAFVLTVCSIIAVVCIHPLNVEVAKTGTYGDCERCGRAFETVAEANLTFIQQIIAGDSWGKVTIPIIEAYPAAGVFLLLVFGIIDLGVINLVLMVIVNAAESARQANEDFLFRQKVREVEEMKHTLLAICQKVDADGDGNISLAEFLEGIEQDDYLARTMASLDIQRQDAEIVYALMDDTCKGEVDFNEFVGTLVATKHESMATKLLFLKFGLQKISQGLHKHEQILKQDLVPNMVSSRQIDQAVGKAIKEAFAKMSPHLQVGDNLAEKLDHRWEKLQTDQAKCFRMHKQVASEMLLPLARGVTNGIHPDARAGAPESSLASFSKPSSCAPCKVLDGSAAFLTPNSFDAPDFDPVAKAWDIDVHLYKTKPFER